MARKPSAIITTLCYFLSRDDVCGGGEGCASQQPLLCRIHSVKLWLFRREKQKATAPVLNIVSFLSVSFSFYLPLLLCLVILLLCLYSTLTPSLYLPVDETGSVSSGRRSPHVQPTAGACRFSTCKTQKRLYLRRSYNGELASECVSGEWVDIWRLKKVSRTSSTNMQ